MNQRFSSARDLRHSEDGFTLIELLIVIVVLGVLASIVVFSVAGITDRGDEAACKANLATAQTAVEAYNAKEDSYPATLAELVPDFLKSDPSTGEADVAVSYDGAGTVTGGTLCD